MNTVKLRTIQFLITGFFLLPLLMGWAYPLWFTAVVLAVLVGLFGLSHGAIDHILASDVLGWIKPAQQFRFMGQYLMVMCLYGLLWFCCTCSWVLALFIIQRMAFWSERCLIDLEYNSQRIGIFYSYVMGINSD